MRNGLSLGRPYSKPCGGAVIAESELLRQQGEGSGRPAGAAHRPQLSERINARWVCDIGQSLYAAILSGIMQKDQAVAYLSVTPPTNHLGACLI